MTKKAFVLIIVIFAMLVFAILGLTLASMVSTDFEANIRTLESNRALNIAEAGAQWAANKVSLNAGWRTSATPDADCLGADDWQVYTFGQGQCNVCCRNIATGEVGAATIESEGYVPTVGTTYLAKRKTKLSVSFGGISHLIMAKNSLNWVNLNREGTSTLNGDITVASAETGGSGYERDNDATHNELNVDYGTNLPAGTGERDFFPQSDYPSINLAQYRDMTNGSSQLVYTRWPDSALTRVVTSNLKGILTLGDSGGSEYAYAESFRTGGSSYIANSVRILLGPQTGSPTGNLTCELRNDSGGLPGTTAYLSGTISPTASSWNTINMNKPPLVLGDSSGTEYAYAESFTTSGNTAQGIWDVGNIKILLGPQTGSPTGNLTCELRNDSGGLPGTTVHSSGTTTPTADSWNTISNMSSFRTSKNTNYWLCFSIPSQSNNNYHTLVLGIFSGNLARQENGGSWASDTSGDLSFEIYDTSAVLRHSATLGSSFSLTANTTYWLIFSLPNQSSDNHHTLRTGYFDDSTYDGLAQRINGGSWTSVGENPDLFFELRDNSSTIQEQTSKNIVYANDANFFDSMTNQAVRKVLATGDSNWPNDDANWSRITAVSSNSYGSYATLANNYADTWNYNDQLKLIKIFSGAGQANGHYYINSDAIVDVSSGDFSNSSSTPGAGVGSSFISIGDFVIKGANGVNLLAYTDGTDYPGPLIGTQDGNITSFAPSGSNPGQKTDKRIMNGLIYSQNGKLDFSFLKAQSYGTHNYGVALVGNDITLADQITIDYESTFVSGNGLGFSYGWQWNEE